MGVIVPGVESLEEVGRGGSGVVHRGWQPDFGRWVAVKVFAADEDARRLERERLAVGRLSDHPGIVPVLGGGLTDDGRPYLVMSYMDGGSLADRVARRGPLGAAEAISVGIVLAQALQVAHDHGIWHRDLKPANILYDRFERPRLADFGIAHVGGDGFRTEAGLISGTAAYLAPELLRGSEFTAASDVFSLGATLYYAIEGHALFEPRPGEAYPAFLLRRLTPTDPPAFSPGVPAGLADVVRAATDPDPARRLPTAAALAAALAGALAGASPGAPAEAGEQAPPFAPSTVPAQSLPAQPAPFPPPSYPAPGQYPPPSRPPYQQPPQQWGVPTAGPKPSASSRRNVLIALAVVGVLIVGAGLAARALGTGRRTGTALPSLTGGATAGRTPTMPATPDRTASATTSGATDPTKPGVTTRATGGAAIREAVAAFRAAQGGGDPLALKMTFYPNPAPPSDGAYASALLPEPKRPNLQDSFSYRNGMVTGPTPEQPDPFHPGAAARWHFSDVTWTAMDQMLRTTERVCRASMQKAGYPAEGADIGGQPVGISHVIVERDLTFNKGKVVARVYFSGGARWSGGYVLFAASGALMDPSYCDATD